MSSSAGQESDWAEGGEHYGSGGFEAPRAKGACGERITPTGIENQYQEGQIEAIYNLDELHRG